MLGPDSCMVLKSRNLTMEVVMTVRNVSEHEE